MGTTTEELLLAGLEKVDDAIAGASDAESSVTGVMAVLLDLLGGEHVALLSPCDPEAPAWRIAGEWRRPALPTLPQTVEAEVPMTPAVARVLAAARNVKDALNVAAGTFGSGLTGSPGPSAPKAMVVMAVEPKLDGPYLLVWQPGGECEQVTRHKRRLFVEVGRRLRDVLTSVAACRKLRENDRTVEQAERIAQLGYWERDFAAGVLRASKGALRILGFPEDVTERSIADWHERWRAIVHPDDRERAERGMFEAAQGGPAYDVEYRIARQNGDVRMVHSRGDLVRDESGRPRRMVGIMQDVTARTRLEEQLLEMSDRFKMLSESALTGIYLIENGQFRYLNDAAANTFGYTAAELIGKRGPFDLIHPDDKDTVTDHMRGIMSGELQETRYDNRALRKDGSVVNVEVQCRRFEHGGRTGIIGTMLDITQRKHLEQQLREAQKMEAVGRLAGGIAHDFNNLLTVIQGSAQLARLRVGAAHPVNAFLGEVCNATDRAADLTRQLLAFSRRQVLQERVIDLNQTLEEVAKLLRRLIGEDIELILTLDPQLGRVKVDPDQLAQAILNLAANARDAMPDGGRITIATRNVDIDPEFARLHDSLHPGPYALLTVSDTGHGMDQETAAQVFEPFFTTKAVGKGTGLGLAMIYGFLKQSCGHIEVKSTIGRGATFLLYLPGTNEGVTDIVPAAESAPKPQGAETVLLAEDDNGVRQVCKLVLEASGYSVLEARNGDEAMQLAADHEAPIPIVITDVVMPGMGGRQVGEKFLGIHPGACVLFLSGYADETALPRKGEALHGFLQKPFTPAALVGKVRELLDARSRARS